MSEFKERLDEAMRIRDISAAELSRISNVNEGAISQYRAGKYKASQRSLDKLARALNVSIPWLMGADVPMMDESLDKGRSSENLRKYAQLRRSAFSFFSAKSPKEAAFAAERIPIDDACVFVFRIPEKRESEVTTFDSTEDLCCIVKTIYRLSKGEGTTQQISTLANICRLIQEQHNTEE